MQKDAISETQKSEILKQAEAALEDICREHKISLATYYEWNSKLRGTPQGKSAKAKLVYGVLLLGSFLAMALSYYLEHMAPFWSHVSRDMGISGLVGFILAMTFERLSGEEYKRLTKEDRDAIKKDVFYYVLGYELPSAIRHEIDTQIVKSPFLREGFLMDVELALIEDPDTGRAYMRTICTLSYRVVNLTKEIRRWKFRPFVDKAPVASLAKETKFTKLKIEDAEKPINFDETELQKPNLRAEGETTVSLSLNEPVNVLPGKSAKVEIIYQTVRFLTAGHFDYVFNHHTLDFELVVRMVGPNIDPKIKIFAEALGLVTAPHHHPENRFYNWKVARPILPFQTIKVKWVVTPATHRDADLSQSKSGSETPAAPEPIVELQMSSGTQQSKS